MPRRMPPDRFERLIECATRVFIERGYQRTQMDDVARALGVAKGTLYLYVEGKEALFDLAVRAADRDVPLPLPAELPVPTPAPGAIIGFAEQRMAERGSMPLLAAAHARGRVTDPRAELEGVATEIYRTLERNRTGIKLIDRSAEEHPELAAFWYRHGREGLLEALVAYLRDRARRGSFRKMPDVEVAARLVLETLVFWAVHRHWDPHPQPLNDATAEAAVIRFVCDALVAEESRL